jgi:hypothetical protein
MRHATHAEMGDSHFLNEGRERAQRPSFRPSWSEIVCYHPVETSPTLEKTRQDISAHSRAMSAALALPLRLMMYQNLTTTYARAVVVGRAHSPDTEPPTWRIAETSEGPAREDSAQSESKNVCPA